MMGMAGRRVARIAVALGLAAAACGCSASAGNGGSVSILVSWTGPELSVFQQAITTFEHMYKIHVNVEGTRGLSQELYADLKEHDPPDVAALPSIGAASQYAAARELQPLNKVINTTYYGQPWSSFMRAGIRGDRLYAVPVKVDVKSLLWYDPAVFDAHHYGLPATWPQLLALERSIEAVGRSPFCMEVESPPTSGWPGADWIADILLSEYGPGVYQEWVSGKLPWKSGPVEKSWKIWGQLLNGGKAVYHNLDGALTANVGGPYPKPGTCYLEHGTLVDEGFPLKNGKPTLKFGTDYDFFPFPAAGAQQSPPIQVSADFIGMFNDTPQAEDLIGYLTSKPVQEMLVGYPGLDGFSADNQVPLTAYDKDDPAMVPIARLLTTRELCFGAADAMPPDLEAGFDQAILEYLADPSALSSRILPELATFAAPAQTSGLQVCGTP